MKSPGTPDAQNREEAERAQQAAQNRAIQDLIDKELRIQQEIAADKKKEDSDLQQSTNTQTKIGNYTVCLILVGLLQGVVFYCTLRAIRRQASLMEQQLIVPYRARFAVGEPQNAIGNEARFPIENYGHLPGRITSVELEIIVLDTADGEKYRNKITSAFDRTIVPGKSNAVGLSIQLAPDAQTDTANTQVLISGKIDYEIGFKDNTDTLSFIRVYIGSRTEWVIASEVIEMNFNRTENTQN